MKVASSDSGMITATIAAARKLPRNRYSTSSHQQRALSRFLNTVCSVVSISQVRS